MQLQPVVVEVLVIVDVVDAEDAVVVVVDAVVPDVAVVVERKERKSGFPSPSWAVWSAMERFVL
jgi:hypothetical protein